jgi:hypothetical protein
MVGAVWWRIPFASALWAMPISLKAYAAGGIHSENEQKGGYSRHAIVAGHLLGLCAKEAPSHSLLASFLDGTYE